MAAPNLLAPTTITGKTAVAVAATGSGSDLLVNAASSGKVLKVNTVVAANNAATTQTISLRYLDSASGGNATVIAKDVSLAAAAKTTLVSKDTPIWVEENRRLVVVSDAASSVHVLCSYEDIE